MAQAKEQLADKDPSLHRTRILVVDGRSDVRRHLTSLLNEIYEVDAAGKVSTALNIARKRTPNLIVANSKMRALDDFDLLLKSCGSTWGKVPIVLYSTASNEESNVNAPETEAGENVITPLSEEHLLSLVRTHLRVAQTRQESIRSLRLSEDQFRTLKTMLTPGVWVASPAGEIVGELAWWWERLTGQTPEQYAKLGWLDVIHPEDKPQVIDTWQGALRNKTAYEIECRVKQRSGQYGYVRSQGAPVLDGDGNLRGWIGTLVDIDASRRAEIALRNSEERHRTFMAMTALAVWTATPNGDIDTELDGWSELTGQTAEQYRGSGWLEAIHPGDRQRVLDDWKQALRDSTFFDTEYRVRRRDGTYLYVRDQGVPLCNSDGTVREWIGAVIDIDEHKRATDALRASEVRYRTLTTATTSAVWNATPDGEMGECPGWFNMTGETPAQFKGWGWTGVIHPDDKQRILDIWKNALQHPMPIDVTFRNRRYDGSYGYLRAQGAPVYNPEGSVREWIGTLCDVDDQKRAEEAVRASEREFRANFELSGIGQVQTDPKTGRYIRVNNRFCEMVGYSADELLTMTYLDLTHPEDRPAGRTLLRQLLRGDIDKFTTDKRYVCKDGSILWALTTSTLIHDAHRRPLRTITMIEDVTQRRQTEALALCQKKALEMVAKGVSLGEVLEFVILEVEKQGTVELRASIQILDDEGKRFRLCAAPSLPEKYRDSVALCRVDARDTPCALAIIQKGPVVISDLTTTPEWADTARMLAPFAIRSIWSSPIVSSKQTPLGTICIYSTRARTPGAAQQALINNVTQTLALAIERKRSETEREELLTREQAAREQAEAANRVKDEFLAVISHELRTPLNAINGWTYMLLNGNLDTAGQSRALQSIRRQVRSQCQLIDDLLDVARIVSGKLRLEMSEVDPSKVIAAALDVVRPAADAKHIDLIAEFDPAVTTVWADSERLLQVIWNLLSNAIKFTPEGGRVEIRSRRSDCGIEIVVTDTGHGISEDFLPYVFDRFQQADISTTRSHGGIGLGLAIVRHLVELHGGTVIAESAGKGKGATFTIRMPVRAVRTARTKEVDRKQEPATLKDIDAVETNVLKGIRVMVVEDNSDDREVLTAELLHLGTSVCATASAAAAITELDAFRPNVLVADIGMPGEDGYSLIRKVRARPVDHGGLTPAIALTAYAGDVNRKLALEAGYQIHITKPTDPTELARMISRLSHEHIA